METGKQIIKKIHFPNTINNICRRENDDSKYYSEFSSSDSYAIV